MNWEKTLDKLKVYVDISKSYTPFHSSRSPYTESSLEEKEKGRPSILPPEGFYSEVEVNDGNYAEGVIASHKITGCVGVVVLSQGEKNRCMLTHYDVLSEEANKRKLLDLKEQHPEFEDGDLSALVLHWDQVPNTPARYGNLLSNVFQRDMDLTVIDYPLDHSKLFNSRMIVGPWIGTLVFDTNTRTFEYTPMEHVFNPKYRGKLGK